MRLKRGVLTLCLVSVLALAGVSSSYADNGSRQTGLVNVSLGDVDLLNHVNLAVAANVAATVCDVAVPVSVLATQIIAGDGATICETAAGPLTVTQSLPGAPGGPPNAGGNHSQQSGLINLSVGDIAILNDVNLAVAANVAATVCDVTVPVAVLALQVIDEGGETVCETSAGPLRVTQTQ